MKHDNFDLKSFLLSASSNLIFSCTFLSYALLFVTAFAGSAHTAQV